MARTAESYLALREDLGLALEHVIAQYDELRKTADRAEHEFASDDPMAWSAVGFMLHNLYNAVENYFLRIAKFFENGLDGGAWHRDLVNRMAHEVPSVRPALLERTELAPFHELRSFRHTFRSLYDRRLDPRRVRLAAENAEPAIDALRRGHGRFVAQIDQIAAHL